MADRVLRIELGAKSFVAKFFGPPAILQSFASHPACQEAEVDAIPKIFIHDGSEKIPENSEGWIPDIEYHWDTFTSAASEFENDAPPHRVMPSVDVVVFAAADQIPDEVGAMPEASGAVPNVRIASKRSHEDADVDRGQYFDSGENPRTTPDDNHPAADTTRTLVDQVYDQLVRVKYDERGERLPTWILKDYNQHLGGLLAMCNSWEERRGVENPVEVPPMVEQGERSPTDKEPADPFTFHCAVWLARFTWFLTRLRFRDQYQQLYGRFVSSDGEQSISPPAVIDPDFKQINRNPLTRAEVFSLCWATLDRMKCNCAEIEVDTTTVPCASLDEEVDAIQLAFASKDYRAVAPNKGTDSSSAVPQITTSDYKFDSNSLRDELNRSLSFTQDIIHSVRVEGTRVVVFIRADLNRGSLLPPRTNPMAV